MSDQIAETPVITENLVAKTSIPNGALGVCPETREILLGAGFGNEPYRLYVDRFRIIDSFQALKETPNHEDGEYATILSSKVLYFYSWHKDTTGWDKPGVQALGTDVSGDYGYWRFEGQFSLSSAADTYLRTPAVFHKDHLLIFNSSGQVEDSGKTLADLVSKTTYNSHVTNNRMHVSETDRTNWDGKQGALNETQMKAVNSGITAEDVARLSTFKAEDYAKLVRIFKLDSIQQETPGNVLDIPVSELLTDKSKGYADTDLSIQLTSRSRTYIKTNVIGSDQFWWEALDESNNVLFTFTYREGYPSAIHSWVADSDPGFECNTLEEDGVLVNRYYKDGVQLYWNYYDLDETALIDVSDDFVAFKYDGVAIKHLRRITHTPTKVINTTLIPPEKNNGYARDFYINVIGDGYTNFDPDNTVTVRVNTALYGSALDSHHLTEGVYHFFEVAPDEFQLEHLTSTFLLETIESMGTEVKPLVFPYFVKKGTQVYKIDLYDDPEEGIGLDITRHPAS